MKFRNYCLVVMGECENVVSEILKVCENKPNVLDAKGILIATFTSNAEPRELTDYFKLNGRSFLIFDLNEENSGVYISKEEINTGLFGFLKEINQDILRLRGDELIQEITSSTITNKAVRVLDKRKTTEEKIKIIDIENMGLEDKNDLMNRLIDKGFENLSEHEKTILKKLASY